MKNYTIKARERQGTKSMDLTLPVDVIKKYDLKSGDIYKIEINDENNELKITYKLVYKNK
ncbi:hypothetical protein [Methanobrevibacter sp. DSM 116169]|uniref:hypothetical protein n=1 Tax=Methanobrevibacter sp. DSM 116169 TaxID=3242727 RepID=UPI0038FC745F